MPGVEDAGRPDRPGAWRTWEESTAPVLATIPQVRQTPRIRLFQESLVTVYGRASAFSLA